MLYLRESSATPGSQRRELSESSALALEAAMLAVDCDTCHTILAGALEHDATLTDWAEHEMARQIRGTALSPTPVAWLSDGLAGKLAAAIEGDPLPATVGQQTPSALASIQQRLPALAARLHKMATRLAELDAHLEQEKLLAMKELAYGAGHEVNNPLANIAARAQTLLRDEPHPERRRTLAAIHRQAIRAHEMISDLMLFARPPALNLATYDLCTIVTQVVDEHRPSADRHEIRLACHLDNPTLPISADASQLAIAITALIDNSLEAVGTNGLVEVTVRQRAENDALWAEVAVADDGPGLTDEVRRHLFDPFFSGREAGRGLGFGLSKCWRIVTEHGGRTIVSSPAGQGACIVIALPIEPVVAGQTGQS